MNMSWLPRGIWRYAILVIFLLVLAAIASIETISSITTFIGEIKKGSADALSDEVLLRIVTVPILALTMGFLFLAGALGVWAIRSTSIVEGRRRVGRFVDAMDYISDGLLAVDRHGRLTGSNPAARELAAGEYRPHASLRELFPCLNAEDERMLLDSTTPQEVERVRREAHRLRAFRFRSQPSEDMNLMVVSDVTGQKAEEMRNRQVARLQLIGRIARGVAHDFNNILTAVSGHASLLQRRGGVAAEDASLKAIIRESQRGAVLASQMLDLSRTGIRSKTCEHLAEHVERAADLLRVTLSADWQVITDISGDYASLPLTDVQLEQTVLNLGLLVADELAVPGLVHLRVRPPSAEPVFNVGEQFAAVVLVAAYGNQAETSEPAPLVEAQTTAVEAGVVQSVVRSMLEEVGGRMDVLVARGGRHSYRCCFPLQAASDTRMSALSGLPEELRAHIANWKVLMAGPGFDGRSDREQFLKDLGLSLETAGDIVTALQHVEAGRDLHAMVFDRTLLGDEADALLRAILKIRPKAGLVVLCESAEVVSPGLKADIVIEPLSVSPQALFQALVRSRELTAARK
jgi:signal transduction histidine kinase